MRPLLLLLLAAALAGCDFVGDETSGPVEGSLVVSVERIDASGDIPTLTLLRIETEEDYSCLLPLDASFDWEDRTLRADVRGLAQTDGCLAAIGPASAALPLDLEDGAYTVELRHLGETDLYTLVASEGAVRAEAVRASVSRLGPR